MPRCQWCRQESQDPNICDWCKRPLTAGWTPTAAGAAAVPSDARMSFQSAVSDARSDRLLVFSILGIVALTAVVFGISRFRNGDQPQVPPPAPVVQQQVSVPRQAQPINSYPDNMPQPVNQFVQPEAPPVEAPAATPDPVPDQLPPNRANPRNAKIAFAREITATN